MCVVITSLFFRSTVPKSLNERPASSGGNDDRLAHISPTTPSDIDSPIVSGIEKILPLTFKKLKEYEKMKRKVLFNKVSPDGVYIVISIPNFDKAELDTVNNLLSTELDAYGRGKRDFLQVRESASQAVKKYINYPKEFKVLHIYVPNSADRKISFMEYFLDSEERGTPQENGDFRLPMSNEAIYRTDPKFGKSGSWASDRYSHLIELSNKSEFSNEVLNR